MKFIIRGMKALFMVVGAACCGLFLLAWSDIHWMLTSPDNAVPPWVIEERERVEADARSQEGIFGDEATSSGPVVRDGSGSLSLDEAGPAGVTK